MPHPTPLYILGTVVIAVMGVMPTPVSAALAYRVNISETSKPEPVTGGDTVDGTGLYTVSVAQGTFTRVSDPGEFGSAGAVVSPPNSIDPNAFLPADRATGWNPGMMGVGGIPLRFTDCATLTPRGAALDDTAQIQAAINSCPAGQVVKLVSGTFTINSGNFLLIKGDNLARRGTGPNDACENRRCQAIPGDRERQTVATDRRWPFQVPSNR
jgi:hypothetical protein